MAYTIASGVTGTSGLGTERRLIYTYFSLNYWAFALTGTDTVQPYWSTDGVLWTPTAATNKLGPHGGEGRNLTVAYIDFNVDIVYLFLASDGTSSNTATCLRGTISGTVLTWHSTPIPLGVGTDPAGLNWSGAGGVLGWTAYLFFASGSLNSFQAGSADSTGPDPTSAEQTPSIGFNGRSFGSGAAGQVRSYHLTRGPVDYVGNAVLLLADDGSGSETCTGIDSYWWDNEGTTSAWAGTPGNRAGTGLLSTPIGKNDWGAGFRNLIHDGFTHLIWRDNTGNFFHRIYEGTAAGWFAGGSIPSLGTKADSGIAVTSAQTGGDMFVAVISNDASNTVYYNRWDGTQWGQWIPLETTPATRNDIGITVIGSGTSIIVPYWTEGTGPTYTFACKPVDITRPPLDLIPHFDAILFWPRNPAFPGSGPPFVPILAAFNPDLQSDGADRAPFSAGSADIGFAYDLAAGGASTSAGAATIGTLAAIAAGGTSSTSGSASLAVVMALAAAGASASTGNAAVGAAHPLAAAGASASTGNAAVGAADPLAAAGASASTGNAAVGAADPLSAAGTSTTAGASAIGTLAAIAATGASTSTGASDLVIFQPLAASGASSSIGSAALAMVMAVDAAGASASAGNAQIVAIIQLSAGGSSATVGSAGMGVVQPLAASGASASAGAALIATLLALAASGSSTTAGSAQVAAIVPLSATGGSLSAGAAEVVALLRLLASGASASSGAADAVISHPLAASGACQSGGAAAVALALVLAAAGSSSTAGAAGIATLMLLAASGASLTAGSGGIVALAVLAAAGACATTGSAQIVATILLSASGSSATVGSAGMGAVQPLAASGASASAGAALVVNGALTLTYIVVTAVTRSMGAIARTRGMGVVASTRSGAALVRRRDLVIGIITRSGSTRG